VEQKKRRNAYATSEICFIPYKFLERIRMTREPMSNIRGEVLAALKVLKIGCVHSIAQACPHLVSEKATEKYYRIYTALKALVENGSIRYIGNKRCKTLEKNHSHYEYKNPFKPFKPATKLRNNQLPEKILAFLKKKDAPVFICKHTLMENFEISEKKAMQSLSYLTSKGKLEKCMSSSTCNFIPDGKKRHKFFYLKSNGKKIDQPTETTETNDSISKKLNLDTVKSITIKIGIDRSIEIKIDKDVQ